MEQNKEVDDVQGTAAAIDPDQLRRPADEIRPLLASHSSRAGDVCAIAPVRRLKCQPHDRAPPGAALCGRTGEAASLSSGYVNGAHQVLGMEARDASLTR
jgi:hypothetical protein